MLNKQGFLCKHCNKTFTASTNIVDYHKQISNDTNMQKASEKNIARQNNVSSNHVNRILQQISEDKLVKNNGSLPKIMGIDELLLKTLYLNGLSL